jgi:hypothetical protein
MFHACIFDRFDDAGRKLALVGPNVLGGRIWRDHCENGIYLAKGPSQKLSIRKIANMPFGYLFGQRGQLFLIAPYGPNPMAGVEQELRNRAADVAGGARDSD